MSVTKLNLESGLVHVWYAWTNKWATARALAYCRSLLSAEERHRLERLKADHLKREYLVTRAVCRLTLSRYHATSPGEWAFTRNAYGRPEIAGMLRFAIRFNLSNTRRLVVCAVARGVAVGIDVEETDRLTDPTSIAEHCFSAAERAELRALPAWERKRRFFDLWTLKEAYLKARGIGLSDNLDQFWFTIRDCRIAVSYLPTFADSQKEWQFALWSPDSDHRIAVAVEKGAHPPFSITVAEALPPPYPPAHRRRDISIASDAVRNDAPPVSKKQGLNRPGNAGGSLV